MTLKADPRFWFSGVHEVNEIIRLPGQLTSGSYELYLSLPDASESLSKRPEYAVQLCSENMWEPTTGYNNLHHTVQIK